MSMWNRKNSVAIQSYSAKSSKPETEERKRVSIFDFDSKTNNNGFPNGNLFAFERLLKVRSGDLFFCVRNTRNDWIRETN